MEQANKEWSNMNRDPVLKGPFGGLCSILFPKKYDKKWDMYQIFPTECDINKSIIHIVFMTLLENNYRWNLHDIFLHFRPQIF